MPREQINYPNSLAIVIDKDGNEDEYVEGSKVPEGADVYSDPAMHVHWRNPGSDIFNPGVQVSLEMPAEFFKSRANQLDDSVSHTSIFTADLKRTEINKLIRVLRTARDKAYGRDE